MTSDSDLRPPRRKAYPSGTRRPVGEPTHEAAPIERGGKTDTKPRVNSERAMAKQAAADLRRAADHLDKFSDSSFYADRRTQCLIHALKRIAEAKAGLDKLAEARGVQPPASRIGAAEREARKNGVDPFKESK